MGCFQRITLDCSVYPSEGELSLLESPEGESRLEVKAGWTQPSGTPGGGGLCQGVVCRAEAGAPQVVEVAIPVTHPLFPLFLSPRSLIKNINQVSMMRSFTDAKGQVVCHVDMFS